MAAKEEHAASGIEKRGKLGVRQLERDDLDAIVAIDRAVSGRVRLAFYEKRFAHYAREPGAFVTLVAELDRRPVGFALARLYEGEFGGVGPEAALDAIGVDIEARHLGIGRALIDSMMAAMRIHDIRELATQVDWSETDLLGFFARMKFTPAPRVVLERAVRSGLIDQEEVMHAYGKERGESPNASVESREIDYGRPTIDSFESLARDRVPVRSMTPDDLAGIVGIDKRITGRNRESYFQRKLAEALDESAVRVSLTAEVDGSVAGFVMARVDFGEFGRTEPEAVMDTIGVAPRFGHKGIATALLSQLTINLIGLRIERVHTEVDWNHFGLLSFLDRMGFRPRQRLALRRTVS